MHVLLLGGGCPLGLRRRASQPRDDGVWESAIVFDLSPSHNALVSKDQAGLLPHSNGVVTEELYRKLREGSCVKRCIDRRPTSEGET
jgi:hypothetical protein